jgi:hypothetical protein
MTETRADVEYIRKSFKQPTVRLGESDVKRIIELSELEGINLVDWQTKGIPAPDQGWGVVIVSPKATSRLVELLAELNYYHWWFPLGIINPEYEVRFSNAPLGLE